MKCQSFLQTWQFFCCLGAFFSSPLLLEAKSDFEHPNSFIGNAGWSGGLELWIEVGEVPVGSGINLPLRLRFASDVTRENSLFGSNWWCPLLESVGNNSADDFEWTTLGGGKKWLRKSGESEFQSKDWGTSAQEVDGVWQVRSEGWGYRYQDGKIAEAITPEGARLIWRYQDGFPAAIRRKGEAGGCETLAGRQRIGWKPMPRAVVAGASCPWLAPAPVISINPARDGADLLSVSRTPDSVTIHGAFGDFVFREESGDVVKRWRLAFPDGWEKVIEIATEADGGSQMTIVSRSSGKASGTLAPLEEKFRWKAGALLSDNDFTYEIRRTDTGEDILHRLDRKGRTEWYTFDTARGLATYKRQDGSRVQSWYHVEPGPKYMKCFRMDTLSKDQSLVSSRLLTYDSKGKVESEWTEERAEDKETGRQGDGVRYIGVAEAEQLHERPHVVFIDARKKLEFEHVHIPGAVRIGRSSFEADYPAMESQLKAADTLVVYCTSRQCEDSSVVATRLSQLGYAGVLVFEGGWAEWWKRHR